MFAELLMMTRLLMIGGSIVITVVPQMKTPLLMVEVITMIESLLFAMSGALTLARRLR